MKLLGLFVLNTVLFTLAKAMDVSIWLVLALELLTLVAWIGVKAWTSKAQQLCNQAGHMGWTAAGHVKSADGYKDTLLKRDDAIARVSFSEGRVYLVEPEMGEPFRDFVEVERRLATQ